MAIAAFGGDNGSSAGSIAFKGTGGDALGTGLGGDAGYFTGGAADQPESLGGDGVDAFGGSAFDMSASGGNGIVVVGGGGGGSPDAFGGDGIIATAGSGGNNGLAGQFNGDVQVTGTLSKGAGSFKIDHPLDPANKYLYHSFVESPDMMNIYNGNVVTDGRGSATITLPDWFEALNRDFRYQLTVIGQFAQAIVATEIHNDEFTIRTDKPGVKVSWQVTGIRQDAYANAHRIPVEQDKPEKERDHYLHPELFGHSDEDSVFAAQRPQLFKQIQQHRAAQAHN